MEERNVIELHQISFNFLVCKQHVNCYVEKIFFILSLDMYIYCICETESAIQCEATGVKRHVCGK